MWASEWPDWWVERDRFPEAHALAGYPEEQAYRRLVGAARPAVDHPRYARLWVLPCGDRDIIVDTRPDPWVRRLEAGAEVYVEGPVQTCKFSESVVSRTVYAEVIERRQR